MVQHSKDSSVSVMTAFALVGQLGLVMALPIVAGVLLGAWADKALGAGGLVLVGGILVGVAVGILGTAQLLMREIPWKR